MGDIKQFLPKDKQKKEDLKREICEMIDEGSFIVLLSHRDKDNVTDFLTNLNFETDRIGILGVIQEGLNIMQYKYIVARHEEEN